MSGIVGEVSTIFTDFNPDENSLPFPSDLQINLRVSFEAASACAKFFRYSNVKRVMTYEALSKTEFGLNPVDKYLLRIILLTFQSNYK